MVDENLFGLTREVVLEILKETSKVMQEFKRNFLDKYDVSISNKLLSELVGKAFETSTSVILSKKLGYDVIKEHSDKEPDLFFTKIDKPLEVKITSTTSAWTGGEFSKRPFDYLLVSWSGNFDEFFVALVHLEKEDWQSRIQQQYYGPGFSKQKLFDKKGKIIFIGRLYKDDKGTVQLKRENIATNQLSI